MSLTMYLVRVLMSWIMAFNLLLGSHDILIESRANAGASHVSVNSATARKDKVVEAELETDTSSFD